MGQRRGAQAPLHEPNVTMEMFKKEHPKHSWLKFSFDLQSKHEVAIPEPISLLEENESSSSSSRREECEELLWRGPKRGLAFF